MFFKTNQFYAFFNNMLVHFLVIADYCKLRGAIAKVVFFLSSYSVMDSFC